MFSYIKEVLQEETRITAKYRSKGITVVKLSSIAVILIALVFTVFGTQALLLGGGSSSFVFITMLVVLGLAGVYVYSDIGGMFSGKVQFKPVSKPKEPEQKIDVPIENRPMRDNTIVPAANVSDDSGIDLESVVRRMSANNSNSNDGFLVIGEDALYMQDDGGKNT
jgi:hypothetical protein